MTAGREGLPASLSAFPLAPRPAAPLKGPSRPNVVVVSHVTPWPAAAGNEFRLARLVAWLEQSGFSVHFVYRPFLPTPLTPDEVRELARRVPRVYVLDPGGAAVTFATDNRKAYDAVMALADRPVADYDREFASDRDRLEPRVLQLTKSFAPDSLIALVAGLARAVDATAVIAQYIFMSRLLPLIQHRTLRMLDLIDVFSAKRDKVLRFGIDDTFAVSKENESYLLARADVAIAIQAEEADAVRALAPGLRVITTGIDYPIVAPRHRPTAKRVLVVGSDNPMNVAGLGAFLRYAWPTVLREVPSAELAVVGSLGRTLSGAEPGVSVLGRIDNIDDAYESARVAINPAVAGTGVKVKTLEAIAHLRPIVVWPAGADGLAPDVRAACSIATNWSAFARQVVRHLRRSGPQGGRRPDPDRLARALSADVVYAELLQTLRGAGEPERVH